MKISGIQLYKRTISYKWKSYRFSGGRSFTDLDNVIVVIETDSGLKGFGECNATPSYMGETYQGLIGALSFMCPVLLGANPLEPRRVYDQIDRLMPGNEIAKSAIDTAIYDIAGKAFGQPISSLAGGTFQNEFIAHWTLPMDSPEETASKAREYYEQGITEFELKAGAPDPADDIERVRAIRRSLGKDVLLVVDPNQGWTPFEAIRIIHELDDLDVFIEQPCKGVEALAHVRSQVRSPIIADESAESMDAITRVVALGAADAICLKPPRVGGITPSVVIRDYCEHLGLPVKLETDAMTKIGSAAAVHLIATLKAPLSPGGASFLWFDPDIAPGSGPSLDNGKLRVPAAPGLGVDVDPSLLGEPVASFGEVSNLSKQ